MSSSYLLCAIVNLLANLRKVTQNGDNPRSTSNHVVPKKVSFICSKINAVDKVTILV